MRKKQIIIGVVTAVVFFTVGFLVAPDEIQAPQKGLIAPAGGDIGNALAISVISVRDSSDKLYKVSGEYPQFPTATTGFNQSIQSFINDNLATFREDAAANWRARQETASTPREDFPKEPFPFIAGWSPEQLNGRGISFLVRIYTFTGGAHGLDDIRAFNYDPAKEREIKLADLFPNQPDYLDQVAKAARADLAQQLETAMGGNVANDMLASGTAPTEENYRNFTFTDDTVTIYFQKYQVAPGAYGEQRVILRRADIR